jgi:hypothetical protein
MGTLPRPLLAALVIVAAFAAAWMLVLRPHASTSSSTTPAASAPVTSAPAAAAATPKAKPKATSAAAAKPEAATKAKAVAHPVAPPASSASVTALSANPAAAVATATAALKAGKVLAVLFVNPKGADDQVDMTSLGQARVDRSHVVELSLPIQDVAKLSAVTDSVQVTTSPTLVVVDGHHRATTVTGFSDPLEYQQTIASAVAAH